MALSFDIAANTRAAQAQVKDLGDDLAKVADSLDDLAREATTGGAKTERALSDVGDAGKDAAREIDSAGDKVERTFQDLISDAKKADRAVADVGDSGSAGFDKIKGGAQELQQEMGANLGEAVSSFRGDITDLGQVGQDTLGGLAATVAGMGPAGLLGAFALAAGAAGLGLFTAGQEEAKQKQEELNEAAAEWASAYTASAGQIVDASYTVAEMNSIATDPEKYKKAQEAAEDWGTTVPMAMRAMAGDATALAVVQETLAQRTAASEAALAKQETQVDSNAGAAYDLADSVKRGQDAIDLLTGAMSQGQQQAKDNATALYQYAQSAGQATDQTDDLGNKIIKLPDGKEIVVDAETQTAYEDLDAIERRQLTDKSVTVNVRADTSSFDRSMADLQRRANQGQAVVVPVRSGKVWF